MLMVTAISCNPQFEAASAGTALRQQSEDCYAGGSHRQEPFRDSL